MTAIDIQVRRAQPGEWATAREVRLAALADAPEAFGSTLARELALTEAHWRDRVGTWPWFLAYQAGEAVGMVAAAPEREAGARPAGQRDWHLTGMWVSPQARGTGAADLLVNAVTGYAQAQGATGVTLWVALSNARARAFYQRMGFQPSGRRQLYRRDGAADLDEEELVHPLAGTVPP